MTPRPEQPATAADTWERLQSALRTFVRNRDWSDEAWAPVQAALEARDAFHRSAIEHEAWDEGYAAAAARAEAAAAALPEVAELRDFLCAYEDNGIRAEEVGYGVCANRDEHAEKAAAILAELSRGRGDSK